MSLAAYKVGGKAKKAASGQNQSMPIVQVTVNSTSGLRLKVIIGVTLLCLCSGVVSYLLYNAFKFSNIPTNIEDIPLLKADITPVRIIPTNPGGVKVENQDKFIYTNLQDPSFKGDSSSLVDAESAERGSITLRESSIIPKKKVAGKAEEKPIKPTPKVVSKPSTVGATGKNVAAAKSINKKPSSNPFDVMESE